MQTNKDIYVFADWMVSNPLLMGVLHTSVLRGKEVYAFEYDKTWITQKHPFYLDPDLQLFQGLQYPASDKNNFGIFLDSCPDRWGRVLMQRREAFLAKQEKRKPNTLLDSDYLLGVHDGFRMGGLRFKTDLKGDFQNNDNAMSAPPFARLRELEYASMQLEKELETDTNQWLALLLAPGSSLGGARPKANVADEKGNMWIAKFPAKNDTHNAGAWEKVAHNLAQKAGIQTVDSQLMKLNSENHTFLIKRFDRKTTQRIHFASGMALLGFMDGQEGGSYLHLAEFIQRYGARPKVDLTELWRRIVFSICIKNTDDHLRNHGFILGSQGWELSPVYDLNPVANGNALSLNISETDNSLDINLALEVAPYFDLKPSEANKITQEVQSTVQNWQKEASGMGFKRQEIERMEGAFEGCK